MQDEINEKTVALAIKGAKISSQVLASAMKEYLRHRHNKTSKVKTGKQTLKSLQKQGSGLASIEVSEDNIKSFESTARKYKIDFALKKDMTDPEKPMYYVFFKSKDKDVLDFAFKEYTSKILNKERRPSVKDKLRKFKEQVKLQDKNRAKDRKNERDLEL